MIAPVGPHEAERLDALRRASILDTPQEQVFDDLVEVAAYVCRTPISTVTFVDADRQWFKARLGLADAETPRATSFCAHAILGDGMLVVPDATKDSRFSDMSNVTGDPGIRFYAGVPVHDRDGFALGTLCVIDRAPRQLDEAQTRTLSILARQVGHYLDLRRLGLDLRDALSHVKVLKGLLPMCAWCKRVRDDADYWQRVDSYLQKNLDATISHGICPECSSRMEKEV